MFWKRAFDTKRTLTAIYDAYTHFHDKRTDTFHSVSTVEPHTNTQRIETVLHYIVYIDSVCFFSLFLSLLSIFLYIFHLDPCNYLSSFFYVASVSNLHASDKCQLWRSLFIVLFTLSMYRPFHLEGPPIYFNYIHIQTLLITHVFIYKNAIVTKMYRECGAWVASTTNKNGRWLIRDASGRIFSHS